MFGDLIALKDPGLANRVNNRALFVGGDCRLRTRVGIGNAEGIQMGNETVRATTSSLLVTLPVPEPDTQYGIVATPFWNSSVYISNPTTTGFTLNFGTPSPADSQISWMVFRVAL